MSELKCPFCQQGLETGNYFVHCHNPHCNITTEMEGTEEMWEALIRAKKQLEIQQEFITKLYLNGNITDEQLERLKRLIKGGGND